MVRVETRGSKGEAGGGDNERWKRELMGKRTFVAKMRGLVLVLVVLAQVSGWLVISPSSPSRIYYHHQRPPSLLQQLRACNKAVRQQEENNGDNNLLLLETVLEWFQGDFDNYRQVQEDRMAGLLPRAGGGHEHIHCVLIPVGGGGSNRLAAFYFDATPTSIFRFRFYRLRPAALNHAVETVLYTLSQSLERKLRDCTDPLQWPAIFCEHVVGDENHRPDSSSSDDDLLYELAVANDSIQLLPNCEVAWSWNRDPVQHDYATREGGIHAVMVQGEALVDSQLLPGQKILIRDQLSLYPNELYIHDRGFDPDTMEFIYGNQRGVPYVLQRVSNIIDTADADSRRTIVQDELAWTLGAKYRTQEEYERNMNAIGGSSSQHSTRK